jgi:hypothetical protein
MDIADVRLKNTLLLRDHFGKAWRASNDPRASTVESSFARVIDINASHWSQIKSGVRQIGGKVARQIEARCKADPHVKCSIGLGSLDVPDGRAFPEEVRPQPTLECKSDDELHALQLFQVLYQMNPQAAKARLLDVLHAELLKQESAKAAASRSSVIPLGRRRR